MEKKTEQEIDILALKEDGEETMANLVCDHCGHVLELSYRITSRFPEDTGDLITGVLTCTRCQQKTIFGIEDDAVNFYPGKAAYGQLEEWVPALVREFFLDAEMCFFGTGFRGAVAMSRACVEEGLEQKGYSGKNLELLIDDAHAAGDLDATNHMLAHGSRLVGNAALHKASSIQPSNIPAVLSAAVSICNFLFRR